MPDFNLILWRRLALPAVWLLMASQLVPSHPAAAQAAGPELSVGTAIARAGGKVDVPVTFRSQGQQIATILFSLDIDTGRVTVDATDADGDGVPDTIRVGLPAVFQPMVSYDATDADGELDVLITGMQAPLPSIPDGTVLTVTLTAKAGASGSLGSAVTFASQPAASFGSTTGKSVTGSVVDARSAGSAPAPQATTARVAGINPSPLPGGQGAGSRTTASPTPAGSSGGAGSSGTGRSDVPPTAAQAGGAAGSPAGRSAGNAPTAPNRSGAPIGATGTATRQPGQIEVGTAPEGAANPSAAASVATTPAVESQADGPRSNPTIATTSDSTPTGATDEEVPPGSTSGSSGRLLVACAILAIATGWWVWRRRRAGRDTSA